MKLTDRLPSKWRHRLFIAYLVFMLVVFLTPTPETGIELTYFDKLVHFGLFFGFALFLYIDRAPSAPRTFLISIMFAAGVELAQAFLPFREVEWADFIAGAAGAGFAVLAILVQ
jgi:VanZ family protein